MPPADGHQSSALAPSDRANGRRLQTPQKTWLSMLASLPEPQTATLSLRDALGHVLQKAVRADRDMPPADRSGMDGFAVRAADLKGLPVSLALLGEIAAGSPLSPVVNPGMCVRIFTGANLPAGADTVVKAEDTRADHAGRIVVTIREAKGANVRHRGENARRGSEVVPAGTVIGPVQVGLCAAVGASNLRVARKPTVAVLATGRELLASGAAAAAHQERDANGPLLSAALRESGLAVVLVDRVSDERHAIAVKLREALAAADAVIVSGGVSVGAYDFVPAATKAVGARTVAHGVAMKPGKPFLFAVAPRGQPIFGLPGNPLSAAVGLHEFVLPALRRMAGLPEASCRPLLCARLRAPVSNPTRLQYHLLGALATTTTGTEVTVVASQSSGDLVAGAIADGTIILPPDARELAAGSLVDFRPWRRWPW